MANTDKTVVSLDGLLERIMGIVEKAPMLSPGTASPGSKDLGFIREHVKALLLDTFEHEEAGTSRINAVPEELDGEGGESSPEMTDGEFNACYSVPKEDTTCFGCPDNAACKYAWDSYNTRGDCLAKK
jgi:hypothetical protein